ELRKSAERGVMPIVGMTKNVLDARGGTAIVDKNGVGSGAVGRLREMGYSRQVMPFNSAEKAPPGARDRTGEVTFGNKRAGAYTMLREELAEGTFMLPDDNDLKAELTVIQSKPLDSKGRLF